MADLRLIPARRQQYAYYGSFGFTNMVRADALIGFHGFAYDFSYSKLGFRLQGYLPKCAKNTIECAGPFPFAFGPFIALGAGAVNALLGATGLSTESLQV